METKETFSSVRAKGPHATGTFWDINLALLAHTAVKLLEQGRILPQNDTTTRAGLTRGSRTCVHSPVTEYTILYQHRWQLNPWWPLRYTSILEAYNRTANTILAQILPSPGTTKGTKFYLKKPS